jgi:hypothetical protein
MFWLVVSAFIWNAIFDLHVTRGTRAYLQLVAEAELGRAEAPALAALMAGTARDGAVAASGWALMVFVAGCATVVAARRPGRHGEVGASARRRSGS